MRILVLEPATPEQHAGLDQRLDHRFVGIAFCAGLGEDVLAGESRRLLGEAAIAIDRIGDRGVDAARSERARVRRPNIKVFAAVTRRRVHETGAGVIGDVIAGEQRHLEVITACQTPSAGVRTACIAKSSAATSCALS